MAIHLGMPSPFVGFLDVHYFPDGSGARAALVVADRWTAPAPYATFTTEIDHVAPYVPGDLAARELPCLVAVLSRCFLKLGVLVVDGNAWNAPGVPGLGVHLWRVRKEATPVVGVAKSPLTGTDAIPIHRGTSDRPLWVTAAGMDPQTAAARVAGMAGPHRLPRLLQRTDALSRGKVR